MLPLPSAGKPLSMQTIPSVFKWPVYSCQSTFCSPIPWALCCSQSFTGRMNFYALQCHGGSNVRVLLGGSVWTANVCRNTRVTTALPPRLTRRDTEGLMWPPAEWRGWRAHLPSCPARRHAGRDTPAWQCASTRPRRPTYGNLSPPRERGKEGGHGDCCKTNASTPLTSEDV